MSERTDQARAALANVYVTDVYLMRAIELILEELEAHQHTYFGPVDMAGKWLTTGPQRDTGAAAAADYLKQQKAKKK